MGGSVCNELARPALWVVPCAMNWPGQLYEWFRVQ
jgi:hypothetical protein